jgi:hypothetical protein
MSVEYFRVLAHHQFAIMYRNMPLFILLAVGLAVKMEQLQLSLLVIWLSFSLPIVITNRMGKRESGINVGL